MQDLIVMQRNLIFELNNAECQVAVKKLKLYLHTAVCLIAIS